MSAGCQPLRGSPVTAIGFHYSAFRHLGRARNAMNRQCRRRVPVTPVLKVSNAAERLATSRHEIAAATREIACSGRARGRSLVLAAVTEERAVLWVRHSLMPSHWTGRNAPVRGVSEVCKTHESARHPALSDCGPQRMASNRLNRTEVRFAGAGLLNRIGPYGSTPVALGSASPLSELRWSA